MERITEMLECEFEGHFYIHQPQNNNISYGWTWYVVPDGKCWTERIFTIGMEYEKKRTNSPSDTNHVYSLQSIRYRYSGSVTPYAPNSIEELFKNESVINTIKSYLNK